MSLAADQRWLVAAIAGPAPRALRRLGGTAIAADVGLDIYRHAYHARLHEALADDFPAVQALIGPAAFAALCQDVVAAHPPQAPTLNRYGRRLVQRLRATRAHGGAALDLARLEWALVEAIHAPLVAPLAPDAFARVPLERWATARLLPAPTLRLIHVRHAVDDCLRQQQRGVAVTPPTRSAQTIAVVRRARGLQRQVLTAADGRLLARLLRHPLGAALSAPALADAAHRAADVQRVLTFATTHGCLAGIQLPESA